MPSRRLVRMRSLAAAVQRCEMGLPARWITAKAPSSASRSYMTGQMIHAAGVIVTGAERDDFAAELTSDGFSNQARR